MGKVTMGHIFSQYLALSSIVFIPPVLHIYSAITDVIQAQKLPVVRHTHTHTRASSSYDRTCYQVTPHSRVLLVKLVLPRPVKKFAAFYETRGFRVVLTTACNLSLP